MNCVALSRALRAPHPLVLMKKPADWSLPLVSLVIPFLLKFNFLYIHIHTHTYIYIYTHIYIYTYHNTR